MKRTQLTTGIAVATALVVLALFFIFNPFFAVPSADQQAAGVGNSLENQLIVQDEIIGTGEEALPGRLVTVHYTGTLKDGTVFDSSRGRPPFQFILGAGEVIPGWDQGLDGMRVGGKRLLIIPPSLGYGTTGSGHVPPNTTLVFQVDLLKVESAQ